MRPSYPVAYDPSAAYRPMMMPQAPLPMSYPYAPAAPMMMPDYPPPPAPLPPAARKNDNNGSVISRIPQYFYPRYNEPPDGSYIEPPPQPVPDLYSPYGQPVPLGTNPYGVDPNYPYGTPYLVPLTGNVHVDSAPPPPGSLGQDPARSDVLERHKTEADLSRLEVYHFTPKNVNSGPPAGQPIIQYHVYPPGGSTGTAAPPPAPTVTNPNSYPWYGHQAEMPQQYGPSVETRPKGIQTEGPEMKNRGISPMHLPETPGYDNRMYPRAPILSNPIDQYDVRQPRTKLKRYESHHEPPLADCRCLECRQRRDRVLNYYPD